MFLDQTCWIVLTSLIKLLIHLLFWSYPQKSYFVFHDTYVFFLISIWMFPDLIFDMKWPTVCLQPEASLPSKQVFTTLKSTLKATDNRSREAEMRGCAVIYFLCPESPTSFFAVCVSTEVGQLIFWTNNKWQ